jgi:hypothetical protein
VSFENRHRLVYHADLGLFLVLAAPWVNAQLLTLIFSFGNTEVYQGNSALAINAFVGLMGVLGFGLSYLRLSIDDSRVVVARSALVKALAATWLFYAYTCGLSPLFLVLALMDAGALLLLLSSLRRR